MTRTRYANALVTAMIVASVVIAALVGITYASKSSRVVVHDASAIPTTSSTFRELTSTTLPIQHCGDGVWDSRINASDALWALNTALGLQECDVCDIDCSGTVTARDALMILSVVVQAVPSVCAC